VAHGAAAGPVSAMRTRSRAMLSMLVAAGALMGAGAAASGASAAPAQAGAAPAGTAPGSAAVTGAAGKAAAPVMRPRGAAAATNATATHRGAACRTAAVSLTAGRSATLRLDCAVRRAGGRLRWIVRGRTRAAVRAVVAKPLHGRLVRLNRRAGTVRYVPRMGFAGSDRIRFAVTRGGTTHRGTIAIAVRRARTAPRPTAPGTPAPAPRPSVPGPDPTAPQQPGPDPGSQPEPSDGLPPQLPPAQSSYADSSWTPTSADTCPRAVHDRFAVIGPDGKRYPTWHPPTVVDPATGATCTFGHEHGRDPRGSEIGAWVADHLAAPGAERYAGIPFGLATESLDVYAAANPGTRIRHEDNPGYKVDYENDVRLLTADGTPLGVACDYLVSVHQGSHSPDALSNNVHELLYAVRCDDGTELVSDTISRFGAPGEYVRSCDPGTIVRTTDNGYPAGSGAREIPDRACVEQNVLVPAGRTTSAWALYEKWSADNELTTADGEVLAAFDAGFGVFNPARYAHAGGVRGIGRTLDLCWETEPGGDRFDGAACTAATAGGAIGSAYAFDDPRSPFDGTRRDVYLRETTLRNAGGQRLVWTDPYGRRASTTPFPGALCQLVGAVDTSARPALQQRVFGRNRSNEAEGVHAPN